MANILLIEPNYKCKYPPLGLMKIAFYHKFHRKDTVWFTKGELPKKISDDVKNKLKNSKYYIDTYGDKIEEYVININEIIKDNKWDRVYVCSLFTFEYEETMKAINYAKELVGKENVYTGGILATLMNEKLSNDTEVTVNIGQLTDSKMIGYDDKTNIDILTPDYSILDNIEYKYENDDAYYAYTTRGCGMKCGFCAVQKLEPNYESFISIRNQINQVKELFGEKKDLLLMDNNVLKSSNLHEIIEEIINLGFEKGAVYKNPKTGKMKRRFVDFNQGLDAFLITEEKAKLLGKIAIKPARIAFDHIEDEKTYIRAIMMTAKNGVNYLSNYLLYNSDEFSGKGKNYKADNPIDLYKRLKLNVELQEKLNKDISDESKRVSIFSFPMRYIPIDDPKRGYVGSKWNKKYLRAIQSILIPTQGKGVTKKSFFEAAFGKDENTFMNTILMPEAYITSRGEPTKIKKITEEELNNKLKIFNKFEILRGEWNKLYKSLNNTERKNFVDVIGENKFDYQNFIKIDSEIGRLLFIHYLTESSFMSLLKDLYINEKFEYISEICTYIKENMINMYEQLVRYMALRNRIDKKLEVFKHIFGENELNKLIIEWIKDNCSRKNFILYIKKVHFIDENILYIIKWTIDLNILTDIEKNIIKKIIEENRINEEDEFFFMLSDRIFNKLKKESIEDKSKNILKEIEHYRTIQTRLI
ncbi:hypothetical protein KQI86_07350 [Clostridium sp. MSJ-11]|uniref:Uncharacterized protein n=1 Tax=Clostridium mobile TaxID=2841512 RepID=A0ABS6EG03_9CLOT|nr:hypothetical protein [Clostridium mobile]MBU5484142.1 hypothetical protein [Clostridium mobile]